MTGSGLHYEIRIPRMFGSEKTAGERTGMFAASLGFAPERVEDIKTAVGEASLNAIEHGASPDPSDTVLIECDFEEGELAIAVSSKGALFRPPEGKPDIAAKIEGTDRPRGWGVFLIRSLADTFEVCNANEITTVRMKFLLKNRETA